MCLTVPDMVVPDRWVILPLAFEDPLFTEYQ
jgi:hypothetical protein